ncbi:hypothetical protein [Coleofasciculus sp.]|uniref:hypothetical protein n=1 Tax=Coleofasciculus sp. TaxID=3100458 RepID=UPI0039FAF3E6
MLAVGVISAFLPDKAPNVRICKYIPQEIDKYYGKKVSSDTEKTIYMKFPAQIGK